MPSTNPVYPIMLCLPYHSRSNHELPVAAAEDGPSRLSTHMKTNWMMYEYTNRNCVRRLRWERATVCMAPARMDESAESGSRTYFNERS